jgi:hypothetical protein
VRLLLLVVVHVRTSREVAVLDLVQLYEGASLATHCSTRHTQAAAAREAELLPLRELVDL